MLLGDALYYSETQPCSPGISRSTRGKAYESFKDARAIVLRDAGPIIIDQQYGCVPLVSDGNDDLGCRVPGRVVEQVSNEVAQALAFTPHFDSGHVLRINRDGARTRRILEYEKPALEAGCMSKREFRRSLGLPLANHELDLDDALATTGGKPPLVAHRAADEPLDDSP